MLFHELKHVLPLGRAIRLVLLLQNAFCRGPGFHRGEGAIETVVQVTIENHDLEKGIFRDTEWQFYVSPMMKCNALIRVKTSSNELGDRWEKIPKAEDLWVLELNLPEGSEAATILSEINLLEDYSGIVDSAVLFLNFWGDGLDQPFTLSTAVLEAMVKQGVSLEIWK